jgi:16S rRNA (cytidine1402-2'-O)-methyltransferase
MSEGRLCVCGTPIGNLSDISARLRETLSSVDVVYAEDTRRVAKLLAHLGVTVEVRSLFKGNERSRSQELVQALALGKLVALVSDAGVPTVSDPGATAVRLARDGGYQVIVIPGPSAVTAALAVSGFPADRFVFEGFLPRRAGPRRDRLMTIATDDRTTVLFASPKRLADDLVAMREAMGDERLVAVTRELTKLHEEVWVGPLSEALVRWPGEVRGEVTIVVSPGVAPIPSLTEAVNIARDLVADGLSVSEASRQAASETGVSRRDVYQALVEGH